MIKGQAGGNGVKPIIRVTFNSSPECFLVTNIIIDAFPLMAFVLQTTTSSSSLGRVSRSDYAICHDPRRERIATLCTTIFYYARLRAQTC